MTAELVGVNEHPPGPLQPASTRALTGPTRVPAVNYSSQRRFLIPPSMSPILRPRAASATDIGRVRAGNDDIALVSLSPSGLPPSRALLIVTDGAGELGRVKGSGRLASEFITSAIESELSDLLAPAAHAAPLSAAHLVARLYLAVVAANEALCARQETHGQVDSLACVLVQADSLVALYEFNCQIYRRRDSRLDSLTRALPWRTWDPETKHWDWSYGARLGEQSAVELDVWTKLNYADTRDWRFPARRGAKTATAVQLNVLTEALQPGDRLLVCTDGVWSMVDPDTLFLALDEPDSPEAAAQRLIAEANAGGGVDNMALVVCDLEPA